jgi:hypothetical protein
MNERLQALIKDKTHQDLPGLVAEIVPLIKQGLIPQSLLIFNTFDRPLLEVSELDAFDLLKKYSPWGIKLHFKAEKFLAVSRQTSFTLDSGDYEKQILSGRVFLHLHAHGQVSIFLLEPASGALERVYHSTFTEPLNFSPTDQRANKSLLLSLWKKSSSAAMCPTFKEEFLKNITTINVAQKKQAN